MSADPCATQQSLTELSIGSDRSKPYSAVRAVSCSGRMVWLIRATASPLGQGLTRTGDAGPPFGRLTAPCGVVNQVSPIGGAVTAPATGTPSSIRPMLTVKCLSPRTKALVPSSGSTRKKRLAMALGTPDSEASSSDTTGMSGKAAARRPRIRRSAR